MKLLYNFFLYFGGYVENQGPEVVGSLEKTPAHQTTFNSLKVIIFFIGKFGSKSYKTMKKIKISHNPSLQEQPATVTILFSKFVEFPETKITSD